MERVLDNDFTLALRIASKRVLPSCDDESGQSYIDLSYFYARLIDKDFKPWNERPVGYKVNPTTEKKLIDFYETIKGKSREEIRAMIPRQ